MTSPSALDITGVSASYRAHVVLHNVSLEMKPGQIACLVGPSGCGKSTLLRCIAGFVTPSSGQIRVNGTLVTGKGIDIPPQNRGVGILMQDSALFPHMNVSENIRFGLEGLSSNAATKVIDEVCELLDIKHLKNRHPHEMSGGQQQRASLARALARKPRLILLDEPFSSVDSAMSAKLARDLRVLVKSLGISAFMVTHDQSEAFDVADQMGILLNGHLLQWGPPRLLYSQPASTQVAGFLGKANLIPQTTHSGLARSLGWPAAAATIGTNLVIRPEDLQLCEGPNAVANHAVRAVISRALFRGSATLYELTVEDQSTLWCHVPKPLDTHVEGAHVYVRLAPHASPCVTHNDPRL
jgi:iron(III) transport system ATP-binding protein